MHASVVSSAILTNSRSSIIFTTLCGRTAVGLYGPGVDRLALEVIGVVSPPWALMWQSIWCRESGEGRQEGSEPKSLEAGIVVEMELAE